MNLDEVQAWLNRIAQVMVDKGLPQPDAKFQINANQTPQVWLNWRRTEREKAADPYRSPSHFQWFSKGTAEEQLAEAEAFVSLMPDADERKKQEFTEGLAALMELGKANHIDEVLVAPLLAAMKHLSENALTHQRAEG